VIERIVSDAGHAGGDDQTIQTGTELERIVPDVGDAGGDRDADQAGAAIEYIVLNAGDTASDRNVCQAVTICERPIPNNGDAVGNRVTSGLASRTLDERDPTLVEQHSIQTAIGRIVCIHRYRCQAVAELECPIPDGGNTGGNRDAG